jgi:hypothetical protein
VIPNKKKGKYSKTGNDGHQKWLKRGTKTNTQDKLRD